MRDNCTRLVPADAYRGVLPNAAVTLSPFCPVGPHHYRPDDRGQPEHHVARGMKGTGGCLRLPHRDCVLYGAHRRYSAWLLQADNCCRIRSYSASVKRYDWNK